MAWASEVAVPATSPFIHCCVPVAAALCVAACAASRSRTCAGASWRAAWVRALLWVELAELTVAKAAARSTLAVAAASACKALALRLSSVSAAPWVDLAALKVARACARPSGGPVAADFVPLRAQHRISAKENQTDGDRAQQYFAIRGMRQGGQGAIKALGLFGADREAGWENDHADQGKDDAARRETQPPGPGGDFDLLRAHRTGLQVAGEMRHIGRHQLPGAHGDPDEPEHHHHQLAGGAAQE